MRVIPPLTITDGILTSSTAAEPWTGETAYNAATTYALGDTCSVIGANSHHVYTSLQAGNVGHAPAANPAWWFDNGPTNRWKMFDLLRNTQTVSASPLTVVLTPGVRVNSLALLGMVADSVTITMTSGGVTVYTHTQNLSTRNVVDWYTYFFESFGTVPSLVLFDLPPYSNVVITVTLTIGSGNVSCGSLVIGNNEYIGAVQYNPKSDALNFSSVTRDTFGNATLIQRRSVPKTSQKLIVDKELVNRILVLRDSLNASPAVWAALDDPTEGYFEALFVLGFYRAFSIDIDRPNNAMINLELEEI